MRERTEKVELSAGPRSRWVGALVGALMGGALGAAVAKANGAHHSFGPPGTELEAAGAAAGVLLGAAVGALVPPGERWTRCRCRAIG